MCGGGVVCVEVGVDVWRWGCMGRGGVVCVGVGLYVWGVGVDVWGWR